MVILLKKSSAFSVTNNSTNKNVLNYTPSVFMDTTWRGVDSSCDITVLYFPYRPKHCIEGTRVRFESDKMNSDMF
jgi:hypothetical protein